MSRVDLLYKFYKLEDDAGAYMDHIVQTVKEHKGDLAVLWHNSSINHEFNPCYKEIYESILELV